jgi:hypothetical protein
MPHFGLQDTDGLGPVEALLQLTKLHLRSGKRRLGQGIISAGIVKIYDALISAMGWYVAEPDRIDRLVIPEKEDTKDEKILFTLLVRSGILDERFDFIAFNDLVEKALYAEMPDYDYTDMMTGIDHVMTQLGVMPFDESALPPENPSTF